MCEYRSGKLPCAMKVTVVGLLHNPPAIIPRENGLSVSIHVGTRKVNMLLRSFVLCESMCDVYLTVYPALSSFRW